MAAVVAAASGAAEIGGGMARAHDGARRQEEYTAFLVDTGRLKAGLFTVDYGVTDWLSVGTDTAPWAIRAFLPVFAPNLHLEAGLLRTSRVHASLRVAGYYASLTGIDGLEGEALAVPCSLFTSVRPVGPLWLHLEASYTFARASAADDHDAMDMHGVGSMEIGQAGAMLQLQLGRVAALLVRGRYQAFATPLTIASEGAVDPFTRADVDARVRFRPERPWSATAAVALLWSRVRLTAGGGYGSYFVPGINLPLGHERLVPEASLSVLF